MALKTIAYGIFLVVALVAVFYSPIWGVCAYMVNYLIGPERQWWALPLRAMHLRFSLMLAGATTLSVLIHFKRLRFGRSALNGQEFLLLLFLGCVWLSSCLGPQTVGVYTVVDHPTVKMSKVIFFVLLLTHVGTTMRNLNLLMWTLVAGALWLGIEGYRVPYGQFAHGRIEAVGGPDFTESNFLAAYVVMMLPLIGIQFLRSHWRGKLFALGAGVFASNLLILTRSRGALLGVVVGGFWAVLLTPSRLRWKIMAGLLIGVAGMIYLSNPQFLKRIATISASEDKRDTSAQSRIRLAYAALRMVGDHPFGIGAGNYFQTIGYYIPEYAGKDTHNTYLRCATELGIQGVCVFFALIGNSFLMLQKAWKRARMFPDGVREDAIMICYAVVISSIMLLTCCLTISLTYVEFLWWMLGLPVCVSRAIENMQYDLETAPMTDEGLA